VEEDGVTSSGNTVLTDIQVVDMGGAEGVGPYRSLGSDPMTSLLTGSVSALIEFTVVPVFGFATIGSYTLYTFWSIQEGLQSSLYVRRLEFDIGVAGVDITWNGILTAEVDPPVPGAVLVGYVGEVGYVNAVASTKFTHRVKIRRMFPDAADNAVIVLFDQFRGETELTCTAQYQVVPDATSYAALSSGLQEPMTPTEFAAYISAIRAHSKSGIVLSTPDIPIRDMTLDPESWHPRKASLAANALDVAHPAMSASGFSDFLRRVGDTAKSAFKGIKKGVEDVASIAEPALKAGEGAAKLMGSLGASAAFGKPTRSASAAFGRRYLSASSAGLADENDFNFNEWDTIPLRSETSHHLGKEPSVDQLEDPQKRAVLTALRTGKALDQPIDPDRLAKIQEELGAVSGVLKASGLGATLDLGDSDEEEVFPDTDADDDEDDPDEDTESFETVPVPGVDTDDEDVDDEAAEVQLPGGTEQSPPDLPPDMKLFFTAFHEKLLAQPKDVQEAVGKLSRLTSKAIRRIIEQFRKEGEMSQYPSMSATGMLPFGNPTPVRGVVTYVSSTKRRVVDIGGGVFPVVYRGKATAKPEAVIDTVVGTTRKPIDGKAYTPIHVTEEFGKSTLGVQINLDNTFNVKDPEVREQAMNLGRFIILSDLWDSGLSSKGGGLYISVSLVTEPGQITGNSWGLATALAMVGLGSPARITGGLKADGSVTAVGDIAAKAAPVIRGEVAAFTLFLYPEENREQLAKAIHNTRGLDPDQQATAISLVTPTTSATSTAGGGVRSFAEAVGLLAIAMAGAQLRAPAAFLKIQGDQNRTLAMTKRMTPELFTKDLVRVYQREAVDPETVGVGDKKMVKQLQRAPDEASTIQRVSDEYSGALTGINTAFAQNRLTLEPGPKGHKSGYSRARLEKMLATRGAQYTMAAKKDGVWTREPIKWFKDGKLAKLTPAKYGALIKAGTLLADKEYPLREFGHILFGVPQTSGMKFVPTTSKKAAKKKEKAAAYKDKAAELLAALGGE